MAQKFKLSTDAKLKGVCGGIAEYLNLDPTIVRIAYALLTFFTGCVAGLLVYLIIYLIAKNN